MGQQGIFTDYFIAVFCKSLGMLFQEPLDSQTLKFLCKTNSVNIFGDHILILTVASALKS